MWFESDSDLYADLLKNRIMELEKQFIGKECYHQLFKILRIKQYVVAATITT